VCGREAVPEEHHAECVLDCAAGFDATCRRNLVDRRAEQEVQQDEQRLSLGFDSSQVHTHMGGVPKVPGGHTGMTGAVGAIGAMRTMDGKERGVVELGAGAPRMTSVAMRLRSISGNLQWVPHENRRAATCGSDQF
jgi:hypothetical protein